MWIILEQHKRLMEHAEFREDTQLWHCKQTGAVMMVTQIGRSIWIKPFPGGAGEVRAVGHLYCSECDGVPDIRPGTPIYEDQLAQVA